MTSRLTGSTAKKQTVLVVPDSTPLARKIDSRVEQAGALKVTSQGSLNRAGEFAGGLREAEIEVKKFFATAKGDAHSAHRNIVAMENRLLIPLQKARDIVSGKMISWQNAEASRRREDQARKLETARLAAEAAERQRLQDAAQELDDAGDYEAAEAIYESNVRKIPDDELAPEEYEVPPVQQPSNTQGRRTWSAELTDILLLAKAVAEGRVETSALLPNMVYLNCQARTQKDRLKIPGVKAVPKDSVTFSRNRD